MRLRGWSRPPIMVIVFRLAAQFIVRKGASQKMIRIRNLHQGVAAFVRSFDTFWSALLKTINLDLVWIFQLEIAENPTTRTGNPNSKPDIRNELLRSLCELVLGYRMIGDFEQRKLGIVRLNSIDLIQLQVLEKSETLQNFSEVLSA